jgi:hypothetical protein
MSSSSLLRLGGIALLFGGIIGAGIVAIHPREITDPLNGPVHVALFLNVLLVLLAWPVVLARQAGRIGILGPIGSACLYFGLALDDLTHSVVEMSVVPVLASDPSTRPLLADDSWAAVALMQSPYGVMMTLALPLVLVGLLAFSIATLRASALPKWPTLVHLAAAVTLPLLIVYPPLGAVGPALIYLGMASYGAVMAWPTAKFAALPTAGLAPHSAAS